MEDMKKLSESELENVSGGTPGHGLPKYEAFPSEDWDIWECSKCRGTREHPAKDHAFWLKNNECSCGGNYYPVGTKRC